MLAYVRTPCGEPLTSGPPTGSNFYLCENYVLTPGDVDILIYPIHLCQGIF